MRKILCCCCFFTVLSVSTAQVPAVRKYNSKKLHLLIQLSGANIYLSNQGQIDFDSAMVVVCAAYGVSRLLAFDENLLDGLSSSGRIALENNDPDLAKSILYKVDDRKDRNLLLLELGGFYLFKPGNEKRDMAEAFKYLSHAKSLSDSLRIVKYQDESLSMLGKYYAAIGNFQESSICFSKVIEATSKSGERLATANALANLGTYLPFQNPSKIVNLEKALAIYREVGAKEKEIEILCKILSIHFLQGEIAVTNKELFKLLELQTAINFLHTHYTHTVLSYNYSIQGQQQKALFHAIESVRSMENTRDTPLAGYLYLRLGNVYEHMRAYENSIQAHKKVMEVSQKSDHLLWYKSFLSIAGILTEQGKSKEALNFIQSSIKKNPPTSILEKMSIAELTANCYGNIKNVMLADWYYNQMIKYAEQINSVHMIKDAYRAYIVAASYFAGRNNFTLARRYLEKSRLISTTENNIIFQQMSYKIQFKIDSARGRYLDAIGSYQTYMHIDDSLYNVSKNRQIQELQIQYETRQREQDIKLLKNEKLLQQDRLKQAGTTQNLTLACISALLLIVGLLYNRYRFKERSNDLLESQKQEISTKNISLQNLLNDKEQILLEKDKLIVEKQELIEEKVGLLEDKEWLLKEIHHRVKNNLQIVMSLLGAQSIYIGNDIALAAIRESQHRVHAISLIHQKLYQSGDMATISMRDYIPELIVYIKDSFDISGKICFKLEIDNILLDVAQAVPVGLILNEAITNSIKYAFPDNKSGEVKITMQKLEQEHYELKFQDNGVGLPDKFDIDNLNSLGMTLMKGLSRQLEGKLTIESMNGLSIAITFMHDQMVPLVLN